MFAHEAKIPVKKSLEEVRQSLFEHIDAVQDEYAAKGWLPQRLNLNKGVIRGLIELFAWGIYQLYLFLFSILPQAFPKSSSGQWLELHGKQVEVLRKPETKARGVASLLRADTKGNVPVKAGQIFRTRPDGAGKTYRFVTCESVIIPDGQTSVPVKIEAEEYGTASNVSSGQITEISTVIPGVDGVENKTDWLKEEGADRETDVSLANRYALRWLEANGVTKYAYEAWALSVPGVIAAKILDQHPRGQGTVDVVIKSTAGIPTDELIQKVSAVVEENRPQNDDALVKGPAPVVLDIHAELEVVHGDAAQIVAEANNRLRALFTDPSCVPGILPLQIGEDVPLDRLISVVMAVSGVKKINWNTPVDDVHIPDDGLAVLGLLKLATVWASEA